jgi:hypothetical protein
MHFIFVGEKKQLTTSKFNQLLMFFIFEEEEWRLCVLPSYVAVVGKQQQRCNTEDLNWIHNS